MVSVFTVLCKLCYVHVFVCLRSSIALQDIMKRCYSIQVLLHEAGLEYKIISFGPLPPKCFMDNFTEKENNKIRLMAPT